MAEKEEKLFDNILSNEIESVKSRKPIIELFKNFFHHFNRSFYRFGKYEVPDYGRDLKSWITSFRGGIILLCLVLVSLIPLILNSDLYYRIFILAMIYAIYAASWDLLSGVTGQVSFGHSAFWGIGAYGCGAWVYFNHLPWSWAVLLGGIYAVVFGLLIAIPCLRFKGPYFALGTLTFSLLLTLLFSMSSLQGIFYGESGIPPILDFLFVDDHIRFIIILIIMICSITFMLYIYNSKLGTIFQAIRDDEKSTEASGINVVKYKIYAFMISAFFAGIAGSLYVLDQTKVDPEIYKLTYSFYPVIMANIGGIAMISGAVFGAYFFAILIQIIDEIMGAFLPAFSDIFTNISVFIFAIIVLLVVRFTERGLMMPAIERTKTLWDLLLGK
jgi:branched-chain amino acid transport system permease protein